MVGLGYYAIIGTHWDRLASLVRGTNAQIGSLLAWLPVWCSCRVNAFGTKLLSKYLLALSSFRVQFSGITTAVL